MEEKQQFESSLQEISIKIKLKIFFYRDHQTVLIHCNFTNFWEIKMNTIIEKLVNFTDICNSTSKNGLCLWYIV